MSEPEETQQSGWYRKPGTLEMVETEKLTNDPKNSRFHGTKSIQAIGAALMRFGQQKPVVARQDGIVIAGNGVLTAARAIGLEKIMVLWTGLAGVEASSYAIADNKVAEVSSWNKQVLRDELRGMSSEEQASLGFTDEELDQLMVGPEAPAEFGVLDQNLATQYACPHCGYSWSGNPKPESGMKKTKAKPKHFGPAKVKVADPKKKQVKWKNVGKRK